MENVRYSNQVTVSKTVFNGEDGKVAILNVYPTTFYRNPRKTGTQPISVSADVQGYDEYEIRLVGNPERVISTGIEVAYSGSLPSYDIALYVKEDGAFVEKSRTTITAVDVPTQPKFLGILDVTEHPTMTPDGEVLYVGDYYTRENGSSYIYNGSQFEGLTAGDMTPDRFQQTANAYFEAMKNDPTFVPAATVTSYLYAMWLSTYQAFIDNLTVKNLEVSAGNFKFTAKGTSLEATYNNKSAFKVDTETGIVSFGDKLSYDPTNDELKVGGDVTADTFSIENTTMKFKTGTASEFASIETDCEYCQLGLDVSFDGANPICLQSIFVPVAYYRAKGVREGYNQTSYGAWSYTFTDMRGAPTVAVEIVNTAEGKTFMQFIVSSVDMTLTSEFQWNMIEYGARI